MSSSKWSRMASGQQSWACWYRMHPCSWQIKAGLSFFFLCSETSLFLLQSDGNASSSSGLSRLLLTKMTVNVKLFGLDWTSKHFIQRCCCWGFSGSSFNGGTGQSATAPVTAQQPTTFDSSAVGNVMWLPAATYAYTVDGMFIPYAWEHSQNYWCESPCVSEQGKMLWVLNAHRNLCARDHC